MILGHFDPDTPESEPQPVLLGAVARTFPDSCYDMGCRTHYFLFGVRTRKGACPFSSGIHVRERRSGLETETGELHF
jgi:hypothetical protein